MLVEEDGLPAPVQKVEQKNLLFILHNSTVVLKFNSKFNGRELTMKKTFELVLPSVGSPKNEDH